MKTLQLVTLTTLLCACFPSCAWQSFSNRPCTNGYAHQWGQWSLNRDGERVGVSGMPKQRRRCDVCGIVQEGF